MLSQIGGGALVAASTASPWRGGLRRAALTLSLLAFAAVDLGCSRVPEQALRDEQARSRRYRDAYETLQEEVTDLRARLVEKQGCAVPEKK